MVHGIMNHGVWCKNKKYARRSIDGSFYLMKYGGFFTKKKKKKATCCKPVSLMMSQGL